MYKFLTIIVFLLLTQVLVAQNISADSHRLKSFDKVTESESYLDSVKFRNIGPTIMSGRVVDVEVNPENTTEFFVAYASGGVWHTNNNGVSFEPIFDNEATHTIGDMAMNWRDNILWVGTGEVNSSRSSYAGVGVYKTSNRGKNWEHVGLQETHHIGKIILHPTDKNVAWVAALGHLYTNNPERGIYMTSDGGKLWQKTLFINDSTGCVDLLVNPKNANELFAASWTRTRKAWNFNGSGDGSAIWKSENGGQNWIKITDKKNGFPQGSGVGRIGIAISESNPKVLYALLDNNFHQDEKPDEKLNASDFIEMTESGFLNLKNDDLNKFLKENDYPEKYTAESVREDVKKGAYKITDIGKWRLADADASLFETPVIGAEIYRTENSGKTWQKMNDKLLDGVYFTYGYYFGTIAVSPKDENNVWIAGYPILQSNDGGKKFEQKDGDNTHADYHRIWINPANEKHLIVGNDGGVNISYDAGKNWTLCNMPAVGQFYAVAVDNATPYNVYGGLQDNGTWKGSSKNKENAGWLQSGDYGYKRLGGGDGMQVQVDTRTNKTIYLGYQFGNYMRKGEGDRIDIKPIHDIGQTAFRFNWQTPILLSKHNQDIFYYGSNKFHRSLQKGGDLKTLSEDLTTTNKKGNVPFGTLTSISESPKKFGLIYSGTDDGNVWRSDDVGYTWKKISTNLPQGLWVSRVVASQHLEERIYVSLNGYRNDDFSPYLYVSDNYGKTWQQLKNGLPQEPINVIIEDPKMTSIIYVGTDNGLYVSLDNGESFSPWRGGLPRVAVHDIAIQKRENEIVIGTHGRSVYIASLDLVQKIEDYKAEDLAILPIADKKYNGQLGKKWSSYAEPNSDELPVQFFIEKGGESTLSVLSKNKKILYKKSFFAAKGWNTITYDLSLQSELLKNHKEDLKKADDEKYYLPVGEYIVEIENAEGQKVSTKIKLVENK